jgi:hypothetical protein
LGVHRGVRRTCLADERWRWAGVILPGNRKEHDRFYKKHEFVIELDNRADTQCSIVHDEGRSLHSNALLNIGYTVNGDVTVNVMTRVYPNAFRPIGLRSLRTFLRAPAHSETRR